MRNIPKGFYVYAYLRSTNSKYGAVGTPYYIGKGKGHRAWDRKHRVKPPTDPSNIKILAEGMSEVDALQAEMLLIHFHGRIDLGMGCLRNYSDGGEIPTNLSAKTKKEMSDAKKGKPTWNKGKKTGPQTPAVIAKRMAALPAGHFSNAALSRGTGWTQTEATKDKIRQKHIGMKHSPDTVEKLRQISLNMPQAQRNKISRANKALGKAPPSQLGVIQSEKTKAQRASKLKGRKRPDGFGDFVRSVRANDSEETKAKRAAGIKAAWALRKASIKPT